MSATTERYVSPSLRAHGSFITHTLGSGSGSLESTAAAGNNGVTNAAGETSKSTAGTGEPT